MGLNYGEECAGLELLRTVTVTASLATARPTRCLESGYFCDCLWQIRDQILLRKPSGVRGTAAQPEATARPNASVGFCGEYVARCFGGNRVAFVRRRINMPSLPYAFSPHYYHPTLCIPQLGGFWHCAIYAACSYPSYSVVRHIACRCGASCRTSGAGSAQ